MRHFFSLLALLILISLAHTQSTPLAPLNGCPPPKVLLEKNCFDPIPGCQTYKKQSQCLKCVASYSLKDGLCVMNIDQSKGLYLGSVRPKGSSLGREGNSIKMTMQDRINMNNIRNVIGTKYVQFGNTLAQPMMRSILRSSFESYYLFTWVNSGNRTFLFEFGVNYLGTITELISDDYEGILENSSFGRIHARLVEKYPRQLGDSTLTRIVSISRNLYKLNYYSDFGLHYVAFLQKIPFLEIKPLELQPWKYDEPQLLNYLYSQHPFLVAQTQWELTKTENTENLQYQLKFKTDTQVLLEETPGKRQRILFFKRQNNINSNLTSNSKIVGTYQTLRDNEDEVIRKVLTHLFAEFSILKDTTISRIQYQVVAGVNYLVYLKNSKSDDDYVCKVFYSLSGEINILEIYLNSVLIHSQPLAPLQADPNYSHETDELFQKVNGFLSSPKRGLKLPENIVYVNKVKRTSEVDVFYQFEIVYEPNSFAVVSYFVEGPRAGTVSLDDLIQNGDNVLEEDKRSEKGWELKAYLEGYRKWLHPLSIEYLKESKPNEYLLKTITGQGSYLFKVIDTAMTGFQIYYYELIDETERCLAHTHDSLQDFLLEHKPFIASLLAQSIDSNSQPVSLSESILDSKTYFRLLFLNPKNDKKTAVVAFDQGYGLVLESIQQLNYGLHSITDLDLYSKAVQKAALPFADALEQAKPIYGMTNSSTLILYFSKSSSTKQTVIELSMDLALENLSFSTFLEQQPSSTCQKLDSLGNCDSCGPDKLGLMTVCYDRIKSCKQQVGTFCLQCEDQYSLIENTCVNDCRLMI